jgi:hypothetical protein
MFWKSIEISWIGLQYAKVKEWEGCVVKIQSPRSQEANAILIFIENNFYKGVPWETCYSIESSQSLKARIFSSSGNLNSSCEDNKVLNS